MTKPKQTKLRAAEQRVIAAAVKWSNEMGLEWDMAGEDGKLHDEVRALLKLRAAKEKEV